MMDRFTIKDIENLSGIKAHTLRIWEQRYNIIIPKRKDSNHRFYDNDDLKSILQISYLYHHGYKISKIAKLPKEDLRSIAMGDADKQLTSENYTQRLLEAAIDFNDVKFEEILNTAFDAWGFEDCVLKIIYPFLDTIGILWMSDSAFPSQEHFSSNIIMRKMLYFINELPLPQTNAKERILLFTPPKEYHEIPMLLMQYLFKKHQHVTYYFGNNISMPELEAFCKEKAVTHLYFHLITNLTNHNVPSYLEALSKKFSAQQIVMSGPPTKDIEHAPKNVRLLKSLDAKLAFAKQPFSA